MLATDATASLRFPLLATPKVDGIRCYVANGQARTRSGKRLPNKFARKWIEKNIPEGFDGELVVRGCSFHESSAALMREDGEPDFVFHAFDWLFDDPATPYVSRVEDMTRLEPQEAAERAVMLLPVNVSNQSELDAFERETLARGFEGVMLRSAESAYEFGRSRELLRLKRFEHFEAVCIDATPDFLLVQTESETLRLSHKNGHDLIGQTIRVKRHQRGGSRVAMFDGVRHALDIG